MNQQLAYLNQLKQTMELYQFMVKLCWLKTLLDAQVSEKRTSGFEKSDPEVCPEKSACKSLSRQEKTEVSTIAASEVIKGRMYDFNNGRFLSVDPYIQGTTSQAINPYSYIQNNPLSGTDPTGYIGEKWNCDNDDYACQFDQSIASAFNMSPYEFYSKNNGINSANGEDDKDGDNSDKESQSSWWGNVKKWWKAPGPFTDIQQAAPRGYQLHIQQLVEAYNNGEISLNELKIHLANANINLGTINLLPSNKGETLLVGIEAALTAFGVKLAGTKGVSSSGDNTVTFSNLRPADEIGVPSTLSLEQIDKISYTGRLNYVVTAEGKLVIGKRFDSPGGGHIDLANGGDVRAAGEVKFLNGRVHSLNNASGHYQPKGASARDAAVKAFDLNDASIYKEKY